jgi:hypothetical protein
MGNGRTDVRGARAHCRCHDDRRAHYWSIRSSGVRDRRRASFQLRYRVPWVESADDGKPGKDGVLQLIEAGSVIPRVFVDSEDAEQAVCSL